MPPLRRWHSAPETEIEPSVAGKSTCPVSIVQYERPSPEEPSDIEEPSPPTSTTVEERTKKRPRLAHRLVEQRYRNSLNGEINALRCLTFPNQDLSSASTGTGTLPHKTAVLRAAAERLQMLESENKDLRREMRRLRKGRAGYNDVQEDGGGVPRSYKLSRA
ncbi:Sterol regulatory element-binding protein 2 [Elasticomyces elasticus]|nr:Sterol regulatory element-binding protein 2 [Elasticomyces elasticus]KAK5735234.1 Sterol regulatory element-binding protein 2 [Elasticomyces elasticus]